MSECIELKPLRSKENNNISDEAVDKTQAASGNGSYPTHTGAAVAENDPEVAYIEECGEADVSVDGATDEETGLTQTERAVKRVKELHSKVVCGVRLWMVVIILLLVSVLVIVISITLSIVLYKDPDEKYDSSSFVVPRVFSGSVSVVNQNFSRNTTALHDLATQLQDKLNAVYRTSHALARYFEYTKTKTLRAGSVIIEFCLQFRMPLDSDLLVRYTLSQEMVSNVLRQHLYDQEASGGDPLSIAPTSVSIQDGGSSC